MLEELVVRNYALIEELNIQFTRGLNILTGETGAGKSILIGALGLLAGLKADVDSIRSGGDELMVSGIVNVQGIPEALSLLKEHGIGPEGGSIIIRRAVKKNGRSSIFIQSSPVTRKVLRELSRLLFDLHGQHEHQSLLEVENHRKLLDRYGGLEAAASSFQSGYTGLIRLRERYSVLLANEKEQLREIDLLKFSIKEIGDASLKIGEEEELEKEQRIMVNHEKLFRSLEEVYNSISENRGGAAVDLNRARQALSEVLEIDKGLEGWQKQLDNVYYELEDLTESIRSYRAGIEFDPQRLEVVEERLAVIHRLQKKYASSIEEILQHCRLCEEKLERIENREEEKESLARAVAELEIEVKHKAIELSGSRNSAAEVLQVKVEGELQQLGMPKAHFKVEVHERRNKEGKLIYTQTGKDHVEFLIAPNPGEPFKKLVQIASGGEISRVMLAIKSVLAESDHVSSLIFDEVDAGIGGEVALSVGRHLKGLSASKQVLCITHLATIAAQADNHIKVEKILRSGRAIVRVEGVKGESRREEIARMLAGDKSGETSLRHADELLRKYSL